MRARLVPYECQATPTGSAGRELRLAERPLYVYAHILPGTDQTHHGR
jgi:hypothetical protein